MLQTNFQSDPIVEILRLAYRRGLAIQREQEQNKNQAADSDHFVRDTLPEGRIQGHMGINPTISINENGHTSE